MNIKKLTASALVMMIAAILVCLPDTVGAENKSYKRTAERYQIPDVTLINQEGRPVRLKSLLGSGKPVIVDFIYGTCTTICPVLSACFVNLQQKLGANSQNVHLVSISIDPENDSPKVMREYLKRYRAKPGWDFLTGSRKDIDVVMRAFDAYIPNKMSHYALTLIHTPQSSSWDRVFGIMSTSEFMEEVRKVGIK